MTQNETSLPAAMLSSESPVFAKQAVSKTMKKTSQKKLNLNCLWARLETHAHIFTHLSHLQQQ